MHYIHLQINIPIRDLFCDHLGDKPSFHPLLDKLAEGVVGIRSIENNVSHVIEHTNEALKGEANKKRKTCINRPSNLVDCTKGASKFFTLLYSNSKQQLDGQ